MTNNSSKEHGTSTDESYKDLGSQALIDDYQNRRKEVQDQLDEVENRPGGFKLDAVGILKKHREKVKAQDELAKFNDDWKKDGGDAIDKAQEAVDKLNFKSSATDHIYAKNALRDAKNNFYKNKVNEELLLEAPDVALLDDGISANRELEVSASTPDPKEAEDNRSSHETPKKPGNYYGLTAEEFTALKALKGQYPELAPVDPEEIEGKIDELEIAFNSLFEDENNEKNDDGDILVDKLDEAVNGSNSHSEKVPAAESKPDKAESKGTVEKIRRKATASRTRKAVRENFKSQLNNVEDKISHSRLKATSFFGRLMSKFNRSKKREDFEIQGMTRYSDGQLSIISQGEGVKLPIDPDSEDNYVREIGHKNTAIILTESGKRYGLANGYVVDKQTGKTYELPHQPINLIIGKNGELPGVGKIGKVLSMETQYNSPIDTSAGEDKLIKSTDPSPFTYYEQVAKNSNQR